MVVIILYEKGALEYTNFDIRKIFGIGDKVRFNTAILGWNYGKIIFINKYFITVEFKLGNIASRISINKLDIHKSKVKHIKNKQI